MKPWFAALSIALATPSLAYGGLAPGQTPGPYHDWFRCQMMSNEVKSCCGVSDGHTLAQDEWTIDKDHHYEVKIRGRWFPVPSHIVHPSQCGENPTGGPVVWYTWPYLNGVLAPEPTFYCFRAGEMV